MSTLTCPSHRSHPFYLLTHGSVRLANIRTDVISLSDGREPPGAIGESSGGCGEPGQAATLSSSGAEEVSLDSAGAGQRTAIGQARRSAHYAYVHYMCTAGGALAIVRMPCSWGLKVATLCRASGVSVA